MNAAVKLIQALEATSSRNEKEALLAESFLRGDREFFAAAQVCLDPIVTFGIKKVTVVDGEEDDGSLGFVDFMKFAERLRKRELTGNAAISAMHEACNRSNTVVWNTFYRRILLKDFKAGFDHSTINRVLDKIGTPEAMQFRVPVFSCQLAKNGDEHQNKMVGKKFLDVKLNGVRLLTVVDVDSKTVTQYTRNGNENTNFPHLREQFESLLGHLPFSVVFDGEVCGRTFQELMSQLNRGTDINTTHHKLSLFDMIPLADFKKGKCAITQRKRHETLCGLIPIFQEEKMISVSVLPKIEVDLDTDEGRARMKQFQQEVLDAAKAAGDENVFEGFMIKDVDAPYVSKKGTNWLKWKPWISVDLEVIGVEAGDPEGKYAHTLGALVCRGVDEGKLIETNVSSGISDKQRDEWWNDPSLIVGYIVELHADEITQNKDAKGTDVFSLRFPAFNAVRGLKPGDKI